MGWIPDSLRAGQLFFFVNPSYTPEKKWIRHLRIKERKWTASVDKPLASYTQQLQGEHAVRSSPPQKKLLSGSCFISIWFGLYKDIFSPRSSLLLSHLLHRLSTVWPIPTDLVLRLYFHLPLCVFLSALLIKCYFELVSFPNYFWVTHLLSLWVHSSPPRL